MSKCFQAVRENGTGVKPVPTTCRAFASFAVAVARASKLSAPQRDPDRLASITPRIESLLLLMEHIDAS